jgi:hypothetical protein
MTTNLREPQNPRIPHARFCMQTQNHRAEFRCAKIDRLVLIELSAP